MHYICASRRYNFAFTSSHLWYTCILVHVGPWSVFVILSLPVCCNLQWKIHPDSNHLICLEVCMYSATRCGWELSLISVMTDIRAVPDFSWTEEGGAFTNMQYPNLSMYVKNSVSMSVSVSLSMSIFTSMAMEMFIFMNMNMKVERETWTWTCTCTWTRTYLKKNLLLPDIRLLRPT